MASFSDTAHRRYREKGFVIGLAVLALAVFALGLIYAIFTAPDLPSFVPGHVGHVRHENRYWKRMLACFIASGLLFALAYADSNLRRRMRHRRD
jgi:amino acid permease